MFSYQDQSLKAADPDLWAIIQQEHQRQEQHIELIASENYTTPAVMAAQGSQLTNKYAEGYPGKRYYGGCEYVDLAEQLAIDRVKALFGADQHGWAGAQRIDQQDHRAGQAGQVERLDRRRQAITRKVDGQRDMALRGQRRAGA